VELWPGKAPEEPGTINEDNTFPSSPKKDRTETTESTLAQHGYLQGPPTAEPRSGKWQLDEVKEPPEPK
jgi:hypothetical protein